MQVEPFFLERRRVDRLADPKRRFAVAWGHPLERPPLAAADVNWAHDYRLGLHNDDLLGWLLEL